MGSAGASRRRMFFEASAAIRLRPARALSSTSGALKIEASTAATRTVAAQARPAARSWAVAALSRRSARAARVHSECRARRRAVRSVQAVGSGTGVGATTGSTILGASVFRFPVAETEGRRKQRRAPRQARRPTRGSSLSSTSSSSSFGTRSSRASRSRSARQCVCFDNVLDRLRDDFRASSVTGVSKAGASSARLQGSRDRRRGGWLFARQVLASAISAKSPSADLFAGASRVSAAMSADEPVFPHALAKAR